MPGAGVGAAVGLGLAPAACVVARSLLRPVEEVDWPAAESLIAGMHAEALRDMGLPEAAAVEAAVSIDMRYRGQGYEVNVPFRGPPYGAGSGEALDAAFAAAYREHYGGTTRGGGGGRELAPRSAKRRLAGAASAGRGCGGRLRAGSLRPGLRPPPAPRPRFPSPPRPPTSAPVQRVVRFDDRYVDAPVYRRELLTPEERYPGPPSSPSGRPPRW